MKTTSGIRMRRLGERPALGVLAPAGDPLAIPHRNLYISNTSEGSPSRKKEPPFTFMSTFGVNHAILVIITFVFVRCGFLW